MVFAQLYHVIKDTLQTQTWKKDNALGANIIKSICILERKCEGKYAEI